MVEIKNNFSEFAGKLKGKELDPFIRPAPSGIRRRMVSLGIGGRPRKFAGTIYGEPLFRGGSSDSSGTVSLGSDLPSMQQLAQREEAEEFQKKFLKNKDKFPLPKKDNDERFKI